MLISLLPTEVSQRLKGSSHTHHSSLEHLVSFAAHLFEVPIAFISLIGTTEGSGQEVVACYGLDSGQCHTLQTSVWPYRFFSENLVLNNNETLNSPFEAALPGLEFWGSVFLRPGGAEGLPLGRLFLMDYNLRELTSTQIARLDELAGVIANQLEINLNELKNRQAQQSLQDAQARLEAIFEGVHQVILILDKDCKIVAFNKTFEQSVEAPFAQSVKIGASFLELIHPDKLTSFKASFQEVLEGNSFTMERAIPTLNGGVNWWQLHYSPVKLEDGEIKEVCLTARNINEGKEVEETLQRSIATSRALLDAIPDIMFRISRDGTVINFKAAKTFEVPFTPDYFMGKKISELLPADLAELVMEKVAATLQTNQLHTLEHALHLKDDWPGYYEARFVVSGPDQVMAIIRDITERRQSEQILQARARQQAAVAELGQQALIEVELSALLDHCTELVGRTLALEYSAVLELLPQPQAFIVRSGFGWPESTTGYISLGLGSNSLSGLTLLSREPCVIADWGNEPPSREATFMKRYNIISSISIVIDSDATHPFGLLLVHSTQHRTFTQDDLHFLQAVANILTNTIQRKRLEEAWWESQTRLKTVINNVPLILFATNEEGIFTLSEGKGLALLGTLPGQLVGHSIFEVYKDLPEVRLDFRRALAGEAFSTIIENNNLAFEVWSSPLHDNNGVVNGVIGVATDITERKRAEENLEARAHQQAVVAELGQRALAEPDLMSLLEQSTVLVAQTLQVEFVSLMELLPEEDAFLLKAGVGWRKEAIGNRTVGTDRKSLSGYTLLCQEPVIVQDWSTTNQFTSSYLMRQYNVVSSMSVIIHNHRGKQPYGALSVHTSQPRTFTQDDIHFIQAMANILAAAIERKKAEEELHKALEKEKELNELKSRFVSMTSHEFRTPLATILANSELLENYSHKWSEDKKRELFGRIETAVMRMTDLLNDVLLISKAEAGKLVFKPTVLNLVTLCYSLIEEVQLGVGSKHQLNLSISSNSQDMPLGWIDEKLFRHIFTNLLSNAVKYSGIGSTVYFELAYEPEAEQVVFQVRDAGIGIPPEDQPHLFEIFHRAKNVGTTPGTGLGLAIVKRSVEVHGGTIEVASQVGTGTTFKVILPLNNRGQSYE